MKNFIAVVIGALFVFGLAATALAIHAEIPAETQAAVAKGTTQVTLGGSIRIRGEMRSNTSDFNDDAGDNFAKYDQRVRLSLDAKAGNASGLIALEAGTGDTDDTYTWGEPSDGATGYYAKGNAKRGDVKVLEAWAQYKTDVVGLKAGHMPLALGNKLFFDHTKFGDDAIVVFADPNEMLHLGALAIKLQENTATLSDDANAYVALAVLKGGPVGASADVTYVDDQGIGADGMHFWNIGLRGNMKAGPVSLKLNGEMQTGSANASLTGCTAAPDCDFGGYAVLAGASAALGSVNVGLDIGIGSGDDNAADTDIDVFVTSLSSGVSYPAYLYGPRVVTAAGATNTGIANTTYVKASVGAPISDTMSIKGDIIWLQATEEVAGEDEIGTEIDVKFDYKITKNLAYWIESGYLMAGDFYGTGADNAYGVRHGLEFTF